jgi:hypothetical protein
MVLFLMILTYLGERSVNSVDSQSETTTETYSLRMRILFAAAALVAGVGLYVLLQVNTLLGIVTILGACLLGYLAYWLDSREAVSVQDQRAQ